MTEFRDGKFYLFNEEILKEYKDEYGNHYYMTKGFNYYYLYKLQYSNGYVEVAIGKPKIEKYIKENNLMEVK